MSTQHEKKYLTFADMDSGDSPAKRIKLLQQKLLQQKLLQQELLQQKAVLLLVGKIAVLGHFSED